MIIRQRFRNLTYLCLFTSFFAVYDIGAEYLAFTPGQSASYRITHKSTLEQNQIGLRLFEEEFPEPELTVESESTIEMDLKILSSDASNYPFEVEVIPKKILYSETQRDRKGNEKTLRFDSDAFNDDQMLLVGYIRKLIGHSLFFKVEKDFRVSEIEDYLEQIYEEFDSPSAAGIFGATPWTFNLLLTQIFHLAEKKIAATNTYPVSCYEFIGWEDEMPNANEITVSQNSAYTIEEFTTNKVEAAWNGNAIVKSADYDMHGEVTVSGSVALNIENPLIQQRDLKVKIEVAHTGFLSTRNKLRVEQTLQSTPLHEKFSE